MNQNKQEKYSNPVLAILTGIRDLFRKKENLVVLRADDRLDGKKVLVTGASSGLGYATAVELARRGAHVIMACRSGIPGKGEKARKESGSERIDMVYVDLTDLSSLKKLAGQIKDSFGSLDVVICNAAVVAKEGRKTGSGLDEMFTVNYFSKFLMINYLVKEGCLVSGSDKLPRIIFVTSESHRNPKEFDWQGFGKFEPFSMGKSVERYGYYKLLLVTLANELSRKLNKDGEVSTSVFALCPGPVNSSIAREAPALVQPMLKLVFSLFFRSPEKACRPVIYLAATEEVEGKAIDYLFLMQRKEMDPKATDPSNGKRLWDLSEKLAADMGYWS